jgi:hypothetical protein
VNSTIYPTPTFAAYLSRVESWSNQRLALINAETGCAVKALVHSGGKPARELVRSTR